MKLLPNIGTKKQDTTVEEQGSENMQSTTPSNMSRKKGMSSADMVFLGGLVLLIGGGLWFIFGESQSTTEKEILTTTQTQNENNLSEKPKKPQMPTVPNTLEKTLTAPTADTVKEATKASEPFVYENGADFSDDTLMPPPKEYEQNISKIAPKIPAQAPQIPKKNSTIPGKTEKIVSESVQKQEKALLGTQTQETVPTPIAATPNTLQPASITKTVTPPVTKQISKESSDNYVCTIVEDYRNMLGKEIMYYVKSTKGYTAAYTQKKWDESGVLVKTKLVASRVDVAERMVEVSPGKWIPALEFMTCTIVQEGI